MKIKYAFILSILGLSFCFAQTRTLSGIVLDELTGLPISFCEVYLEPHDVSAVTDEIGKFHFEISEDVKKGTLVFEAPGYAIGHVPIIPGNSHYTTKLEPESLTLETMVITGSARATRIRENPVSIVSISNKEIDSAPELNVIDALVRYTPGLSSLKTGPNISKPFIHGLGYNRVLTLYDGIRQEGQQYGDEHGLEVDDYHIDHAEVIKGPASLLYGSDAVAGVINLFPYIPKRNDGEIHGKFISEYHTNNNLIGSGLRLDYSDGKFLLALRGSYRMAKNYRNKIDGRVYLTNFREGNFSALAGYAYKKGYTHLNFTLYDNRQGIPDGSRDSLTRKFTKQVFEDDDDIFNRPIVSRKELNSYRIPDLSQHIQHYRLYMHSFYEVGDGDLDFTLGAQQNIRREYTHPLMPKQPGMSMRLNTLSYNLKYNAPRFANLELAVGVNGMLQQNKNKNATEFPIPNYDLYDIGTFVYAKWKKEHWTVSGGLRYDFRHIRWGDFYVAEDPVTGFEYQVKDGTEEELQFAAYRKTFNGISGSLGTTYRINHHISLKANVGRAYRAPNITEIGSNGLDPGAHIIYIGNRNFKPEFSFQEDLGISIKFMDFSGEAGFFNNHIRNYIYTETLADENGNPILDLQGNRTQEYKQSSAQLYGAEFSFSLHPQNSGFRWDNSLDMVYGYNRKSVYRNKGTEGEYLPMIPPLKLHSRPSYKFTPAEGFVASVTPYFEMDYSARQKRFFGLGGTETFTAAYTLFNIGAQTELNIGDSQTASFAIGVNNVFDKAYQSHLNRLKYFEYYAVSTSGHYGIYDMGRNVVFKLIISL